MKVGHTLNAVGWTTLIGMVGAFFFWVIGQVEIWEDFKSRLHTSPEEVIEAEAHTREVKETMRQKLEFEYHVDEVAHDMQDQVQRIDTMIKRMQEWNERNAITVYQVKKNSDSIINLWKDYNEQAKQ